MGSNTKGIIGAIIGAIGGIIVGTILTSIFNGTEELLWGDRWLPWIYYGIPIINGVARGYDNGYLSLDPTDFYGVIDALWSIIKTVLIVFLVGLAIGIIMLGIAVFLNILKNGGIIIAILFGMVIEACSAPIIYITCNN